MRYCRTHERIWYPGGGTGAYHTAPSWEPLPWERLCVALRLARAAGCAEILTYEEARCDVCQGEQR